jgi:hypothetical protein
MADTNHHATAAPVEGDGVSYSGIVWFVVILTVTTLVCQGLMWIMLRTFQYQATVAEVSPVAAVTEHTATEGRVYPAVTAIGSTTGPQPKLLVNEPLNLKTFRAQEHETLTTYGWADRTTGAVRIPIDRAKDLLIERGLPVRGADATKDPQPAAAKVVKK